MKIVYKIARTKCLSGDFNGAISLCNQILEVKDSLSNNEPMFLANVYRELSDDYYIAKEYNQSLKALRNALRIRRKELGEYSSENKEIYILLIHLCERIEDYPEAERYRMKLRKIEEQTSDNRR